MTWVLWRYVCVELLKVMLLTTSVLVIVIAFGATIKPLIQNQLDPLDVGKYALLASVPMLQFALPFAAGFASTMVLHRMANDNEILAMSVSGMTYRRIFTPVFLLGLVLTIFMLFLVHFAVPHFWTLLREMITRDVTRVFTSTVEKGEALDLGRTQLFADDVLLTDEPPDTGADERLILLGVAALETDEDGNPRSEFTARYATVDIHHRRRDALLKLALVDATIFRHDDGSLIFVPKAVPEALSLSKEFSSGPKTMDSLELLELWDQLEVYPAIVSKRESLVDGMVQLDAFECIAAALADGGTLEFASELRSERIQVSGARLDGSFLRGDPIKLVQFEDREAVRRAEVDSAELVVISTNLSGEPKFELRATTDEAYDLRGRGDLLTRWPPRLTGLVINGCPREPYLELDNGGLLAAARSMPADMSGPVDEYSVILEDRADRLEHELFWTDSEILARLVQRSAQSVTALLLLMLGAVLAVLMRHSLALGIYALAFIPAIADVLMISGGEQMIKYGDAMPGIILAWSGNGLLVFLIAIFWWRLSRN
ncbi:MAG: LptF/LptG family permease [Phycisphaerales bacterium]|jgi:lipopolysaccharide export LptBFGC system permease protein LptF|nr:LptF/LptG family permease [Phycisphaerales bacterium]